jgi:hypothetical protein
MKINIGTNKKNIVGVEINKRFNDIKYEDILEIVKKEFGTTKNINIHGWCKHKK